MQATDSTTDSPQTLLIACGALAHEIVHLIRVNRWQHMVVQCLPADLHNTPKKIPQAVGDKIRKARGKFEHIFVAYADCGTGGELDRMLQAERIERLPGAHCYEFFAGTEAFAELHEQEHGTFYLTDFLTRHFDRLVWQGLGLDRHPGLVDEYFRHYRRLVYLSQKANPQLIDQARAAAARLGLDFEHRVTGYGDLENTLNRVSVTVDAQAPAWRS